MRLLVTILAIAAYCEGAFLHSSPAVLTNTAKRKCSCTCSARGRTPRRTTPSHRSNNSSTNAKSNPKDVVPPLDQYDFSSLNGWDQFYTHQQQRQQDHFEWHSSIPHSFIIEELQPRQNILIVGNGNSRLPFDIYTHFDSDVNITVVDYSQPCIDFLRNAHQASCPSIQFVCGDATNLEQIIHTQCTHGESVQYDIVIDKGLMDAMMCTDGWDGEGNVKKYFHEVGKVLNFRKDFVQTGGGKIVLVAYRLSSSTRDFLEELGRDIGVEWEEDEKRGNGRVSFLIGTPLKR
mmetsp:Transcript_19425/g.28712  ORF Transcript_19425/g.28712 Transcript_19425/m.28712 type:complete len:290 (+) Transcript_19425:146-1015(+)